MRELCPDAPVRAVSRSYDDDACKTATEPARWYALTVRHQQERQTERSLKYKGWETLVPVYIRRTRWSDRIKEVECPLFSGYILCHFPLEQRIRVLDTPGVAKIVGFGGVPAAIEEREIEEIRVVVASGVAVRPWPYLKAGDRVRVERGPLRGIEGTLLKAPDRLRLVIGVELLQRSLAVEVDPDMVVPVKAFSRAV
jgi:transcription antitermination factor NusG